MADRREFLQATAAASGFLALARSSTAQPFAIEEATIEELQVRMRSGALTARALTQAYLDRIESIDRKGPTLRSVIETNPDALAIADALDEERSEQGPARPRSTASRCSSRTTSTPPIACRRLPVRWRSPARPRRATRSSCSGCARRAR